MPTLELFPDEAASAKRKRTQQIRLKRIAAQRRIEEHYSEEAVQFVLKALRKHGPFCGQAVYMEMREMDVPDYHLEAMWLHGLMFFMADAGILWRHDWSDEIAVFGIRGEHSKKEFLRRAKEPTT